MLMHASTHSSNFDENTDSTAMSLTVIAYQWGWNYFFPSDTISKLKNFSGGMQQTSQFDQTPESRVTGSKHSHLRKVSPYYDHAIVRAPSFVANSLMTGYGAGTYGALSPDSIAHMAPNALTGLQKAPLQISHGSVVALQTAGALARPALGGADVQPFSVTRRFLSVPSQSPSPQTALLQAPDVHPSSVRPIPAPGSTVAKQSALNHLTTVAPIGSSLEYYRPTHNGLLTADLHADLSEGAAYNGKLAESSTSASAFSALLANTPSKILLNNVVTAPHSQCALTDALAPSSGRSAAISTEQVQLYALGNDFDPEFFADRFGTDLTMTRSSSRSDYSISLVGGLVSRMRITSGITVPSDIPIHLICGSKDVIHSWAIPGLSVKVDCIPGYNCHRRLLIR